jgi:hypothetical protein
MRHRSASKPAREGSAAGWVWADLPSNASEAALTSALAGLDVQASVAMRRRFGVVRLLARDRQALDHGLNVVRGL